MPDATRRHLSDCDLFRALGATAILSENIYDARILTSLLVAHSLQCGVSYTAAPEMSAHYMIMSMFRG